MDKDQIGRAIGIVKHTLSITNVHEDKVQITVNVDFRTASDVDIKTWLTSNRVIAGQRPWRSLSKDELEALNDQTFIAQNIGQKVKSREEQLVTLENGFISAGVDAAKAKLLAMTAMDNPELLEIKQAPSINNFNNNE